MILEKIPLVFARFLTREDFLRNSADTRRISHATLRGRELAVTKGREGQGQENAVPEVYRPPQRMKKPATGNRRGAVAAKGTETNITYPFHLAHG